MIRKIFLTLSGIIVLLVILNWELVIYGLGQAKGQIRIIRNARPVEEVLSNPDFPDSLKLKIRTIETVRQFAMDSIGLTNSDNYTSFYDQKGKTVLWNLSACEPYSFTPKTWSFPLLGSFPYKGFFDLEKAKAEHDRLTEENYDSRIRPVSGWSTLGWFSDPILSNMLDRSEGGLADLIIHELTHSTLFIKDNIEFNENLASFIGQQGALMFLKSKYGKNSYEVESYRMDREDGQVFTRHMLYSARILDSLYNSFESSLPDSVKEVHKHILIDEIMSSTDTIHFHDDRYYKIFRRGRPNNAYFMSFLRYHSVEDSLRMILSEQYNDDLSSFIKGMKAFHED